jgi:hypothetical protein
MGWRDRLARLRADTFRQDRPDADCAVSAECSPQAPAKGQPAQSAQSASGVKTSEAPADGDDLAAVCAACDARAAGARPGRQREGLVRSAIDTTSSCHFSS